MTTSTAAGRLAELARSLGGRFGPAALGEAPLDYGDPTGEYRTLRSGCGLRLRAVDVLELAGADRHRFLNGLMTCDVKSLSPGEGTYGFFTTAQARILADGAVAAGEERIWVELPTGTGEEVEAHLRRYLIADRVTPRLATELLTVSLAGPGAAAAARSLDGEAPALPWAHRRLLAGEPDLAGAEARLRARPLDGLPGFDVWLPEDGAAALVARLLAIPGVRPVGEEAAEAVRVEAGVPRCRQDFGAENLPQEVGSAPSMSDAVSFTKGCYLGQEIVARIRYRGHVNRMVCGLLLEAEAVAGSALLYEEQDVGRLTSAVHSPALERPIGLAVIHRKAAETGTRLALASGGTAQVTALPFVPAI